MHRAYASVFALLAAWLLACHAQPLEVVELNAESFEHQTQAYTGQTTGHWCVLFVNSTSSNKRQAAAEQAWVELAADEEKATIFAKVDVASSPSLGRRFFLKEFPAVILLRDRQLFRLPGGVRDTAPDAVQQQLLDFLAGSWREAEPEAVPPEPSAAAVLAEALRLVGPAVKRDVLVWTAGAALLLGALIIGGAMIVGVTMAERAEPRPPRAAPAAPADSGGAAREAAPPAPAAAPAPGGQEGKAVNGVEAVDEDGAGKAAAEGAGGRSSRPKRA